MPGLLVYHHIPQLQVLLRRYAGSTLASTYAPQYGRNRIQLREVDVMCSTGDMYTAGFTRKPGKEINADDLRHMDGCILCKTAFLQGVHDREEEVADARNLDEAFYSGEAYI